MKKNIIPALSAGLLCSSLFSCNAAPKQPLVAVTKSQGISANLRGYGKVTANFSSGRAEFLCESAEKADMLFGKLLADLFWDAGALHIQKTVNVGGRSMIVHQQPAYGAIVAGRSGNKVVVVGAADEAKVVQAASKEAAFKPVGVKFAPDKQYPIYLDFYDLRALKFYTWAMGSPNNEGLDSHWPFINKFGVGGLTMQGPSTNFGNPAPGVITWAAEDYEVKQAELNKGMIVPSLWMGGEVAPWMRNDYPDSMMQPSPMGLMGAWNGVGPAGAHFLSWGLPKAQADVTIGQFARQVVNRYKESSAVGGWHLYAGSPGGEMAFHDRTTVLWDYSKAGQAAFRDWLRTERKLTLPQLGIRWYGDAARFKSWDEVMLPDIRGFYGDIEHGAMRLTENWQWMKSDPNKLADEEPTASAKGWIPVAMQPSQEQAFLPWGAAFYRTTFNADQWLKGKDGKDVYLTADVFTMKDQQGTQVWLNGELLGDFKSQLPPGPFSVPVTGKIKPGNNELTLRVPSGRDSPTSDGKLFGPVALTVTKPNFYPFLGKQANARWVDLREWQAYGIYRGHVLAAQSARAVDPNRPIILSAASQDMANYNNDLAIRFGLGTQFTGREAYYFPWNARNGYLAGFYGTSEPSATTSGTGLDRTLGWALIDGDSNINLFLHIEDYMKQERETGWFTKNKQLIRLIGKTLPEKPQIALLHSAKTLLLGSEAPNNIDIGRGELHAAHYDYSYATEREVLNGDIKSHPVLFDCASEFLDDAILKGIEDYVREGGTFVSLQQTGRHSPLEPNTYPISKLTGFKVVKGEQSGKIRFAKNLSIFKGWEDREFNGDGSSLEANPAISGTKALANWGDGTVAVGVRTLGKGRVISLNSSFWRTYNADQSAFFERLFTDLGVMRNTQSSDQSVWTRKVITKNGLQNWLLAFNTGGLRKADVSFKVGEKPAQVIDLLSNAPIGFSYVDGWVKVANVDFADQGTRAFAVARTDFADALPYWWGEKTKYWQQTEGGTLPPVVPNTRTIVFDKWKFQTDLQGANGQKSDWMQPGFNDASWESLVTGPWNLQDDKLKDYQGAASYRAKFTVPANWKGRTITFNMYSFGNPIVYDKGEFFLNGQKVVDYQGHPGSQTLNYDVTKYLKPGENVLSVKVQGGKQMSGISGGLWLEPERVLVQTIDLAGNWQAIGADYLSRHDFAVPGNTRSKYVEREFSVPANWKGRDVFVHVENPGPGQWMKSIVINGHPLTYNSFLHPFGLRTELNISPYIKFGETNHIRIWPWNTIGVQRYAEEQPEDQFDISKIFVGVTAPKN